jgi:hypothetical protein
MGRALTAERVIARARRRSLLSNNQLSFLQVDLFQGLHSLRSLHVPGFTGVHFFARHLTAAL